MTVACLLLRHQPPSDGEYLVFLTPLLFFDPQQRSFQSILVGTQFSLSFNRQNSFTHFCFHLSARAGQTEILQFKLRGRQQGSGFPTVLQAAPANPGTAVSGDGCRLPCAVCPVIPHWPAVSKQGWLFYTHTDIEPPHCVSKLVACCFVLSWAFAGNALSFFLSFPRYKRLRFCCVFPKSCNPLLISASKMLSSSSKGRCKRRTKYH